MDLCILEREIRKPTYNTVYKALGDMQLDLKIMNINKQHSKLKVRCFKTPNASYTHRYGVFKKRH